MRTSPPRRVAMDRRGIVLDVATPWGKATLASNGRRRVQRAEPAGRAGRVAGERRAARRCSDGARRGSSRRRDACSGWAATTSRSSSSTTRIRPMRWRKCCRRLKPAVAEGGELVCVFGCGGDRDPGKRPQMGAIAGRLADRVVVTSDNPRGEDPAVIASAVVKGIRETANRRWSVENDRRAAIAGAIATAKAGDIVLIAGKGHETYQERNRERTPFSDAAESAAALDSMERRMMDTATAARVLAGQRVGASVRLPARDDRQPRAARRRSLRRAERRALRRSRLRARGAGARRRGGAGRARPRAGAARRAGRGRRSARGAGPARRVLARASSRCR